MRYRVQGAGCRVQGAGCGIEEIGIRFLRSRSRRREVDYEMIHVQVISICS